MTPDAATSWQAIGSVVTALATAVLAVITGLYVRATRRILEQSARQATAAEKQAAAMREDLEFMRRAAVPEWALVAPGISGYLQLEFKNLSDVAARQISYGLKVTSGPQAKEPTLNPPQCSSQRYVAAGQPLVVKLNPGDVPFKAELFIRSTGRYGRAQTTSWTVTVHQEQGVLKLEQSAPRVDYS